MKSPTLNQKRLVAGIFLAIFLLSVANEYFELGVFGAAGKGVRLAVMFVGLLGFFVFGPRMLKEIEDHNRATQEAEETVERARDKSNDAAEGERVHRAIGMPPNKSLERTRER